MNDWISVEDELPKEGESVFTIGKIESGWSAPISAKLYKGKFLCGYTFQGDRFASFLIETKPTHWMPLPQPPKD